MRKFLSRFTLTFTLLSTTSVAFASTPSYLAQFPKLPKIPGLEQATPKKTGGMKAVDKIKALISEWEAKLANKDMYVVYERVQDHTFETLRDNTISPFFKEIKLYPEYKDIKAQVLKLRTQVAQRGVDIGQWWRWEFDDQPITDDLKKYFDSIYIKFNSLSSSSTHFKEDFYSDLKKIEDILKRPEFESNPVLKYYKENIVLPRIQGAKVMDALYKVKHLERMFKSLRDFYSKNATSPNKSNRDRIRVEATRIVKAIDDIKKAGLNLKEHKIKLDPREPLSEEWDLERVNAESMKMQKIK